MNLNLQKLNPLRTQRWDPFAEMEEMHRRLETLFGPVPLRHGNGGHGESIATAEWAPPVDITEDDQEYLVKAELPEVNKNEVQVSLDQGVLTIKGERKYDLEEKGKRQHRIERGYGMFTRSFSLPDGVNPAGITAEFKDGLLKVRVPKDAKAKARAIEIKVN